MEPQTPLYNDNITIFGETTFRDQRKKFGMKALDRTRHMYVVGKTGMGKTSMLEHMLLQDIRSGSGVCVVDGHGDVAQKILHYLPKNRIKDVIYLDATDVEHPFSFNILGNFENEFQQREIVEHLLKVFRELWSDSWGTRFEYVFKNTLLTLEHDKKTTFLHIIPFLMDQRYQEHFLHTISDHVLREFWFQEFQQAPEEFYNTAVEPLRHKLGHIMSNRMLRNIIGQSYMSFSFDEVVQSKKIVFLVLPQSKIGSEAVKLLGSLFITHLFVAMKQRREVEPEDQYHLYVDDVHLYTEHPFVDLVGTERSGLSLVLTNQYLSQIPEKLRKAILTNIGTLVAFRLGEEDAELLAREFQPTVAKEDMVKLQRYFMAVKLSIDGETTNAFIAKSLEPLPLIGLKDRIIAYSRTRYADPKETVEKEVMENLRGVSHVDDQEEEYEESEQEPLEQFRQQIQQVTQADFTSESSYTQETSEEESSYSEYLKEIEPGEEISFP